MNHLCITVLTLSEICFKLVEAEVRQGNLSGVVAIVTEGLGIERSVSKSSCYLPSYKLTSDGRMLLTAHVKSLGCMYSMTQKNNLMERQHKL